MIKNEFDFIENKQEFFDNLIKIVNIYGYDISDTTEMFYFLEMLVNDLFGLKGKDAMNYVNSVYKPHDDEE